MTDYICELDNSELLTEHVDDGKDQVILVSRKASVYRRKYRMPREAKEAMRLLEKLGEEK
mgnify:CR=1 FL=1